MAEKESNSTKKKSGDFRKRIKKNPWILSTFIFALVLVLILITGFSLSNVSKKKASSDFVEFINSAGGSQINSLSAKEFSPNLYEVTVISEGQEIPVYLTKDGKYFVQVIAPITGSSIKKDSQPAQTASPQEQSSYSQEDLAEIGEVMECLADAGVKVYGANWCGYTKSFVQTLGGFDVAAPIYVECTEEEALCAQEGITGYPTTKINGERYSGPRTFAGLSEVTGCPVPKSQPVEKSSYSQEDLEKLSGLMQCLASKGVKVYGANWCGYTQQLANNLGGFGVISPIYVECTEEEALCAQEGITGYPTIKVNGESKNIERTIKGFADAVGCEIPEVEIIQNVAATASC